MFGSLQLKLYNKTASWIHNISCCRNNIVFLNTIASSDIFIRYFLMYTILDFMQHFPHKYSRTSLLHVASYNKRNHIYSRHDKKVCTKGTQLHCQCTIEFLKWSARDQGISYSVYFFLCGTYYIITNTRMYTPQSLWLHHVEPVLSHWLSNSNISPLPYDIRLGHGPGASL